MAQHEGLGRVSANAPDLVGRHAELARLAGALDAAEARTPAVVLLEGATGMGKTTLLGAAADVARDRGFRVGKASTSSLEQNIPFSVVRQLFENLADRELAGHVEAIIGTAEPHSYDEGTGMTGPSLDDIDEMAVHRTYNGLYQLVTTLAEHGPLCLIVDDLQWTDVPSLRWLTYLVRRPVAMPVAVLLSRTTGVYPVDPLEIAEMEIHAERVTVGGLPEPDISRFVDRMLGRPPDLRFIAACVAATGGNPLVLQHLLSAMRQEGTQPDASAVRSLTSYGPEELGESVLARLNRQSSQLVRLARAIAVAEPTELEFAAALAGMPLPEAADGVRQLVRMGLMAEGDKPAFAHFVIKDAIANSVSHADRDELHADAARHLHARRAPATLVASHVQRTTARLGTWAADALRRAADAAISDGDPVTAAGFLSRALREELPRELRTNLLTRLGLAETYFDPHQAATHLEEAMEHLDDPEDLLNVTCRLSQVFYLDGRYDDAREVLCRSIDKVRPFDAEITAQLRLALRVTVPTRKTGVYDIDPHELPTEWRRGGARGRKVAALIAEDLSNRGEDLAMCREAALVALSAGAAQIIQDPQRLLSVINSLLRADEFDLAMRYTNEALTEGHRQGLDLICVLGHALRSRVHHHCGSLAEAVADAQLALSAAQRSDLHQRHFTFVYATEALMRAQLYIGDADSAHGTIERIGLVNTLPNSWHHTLLLHSRGVLRMRLGDAVGALADQLECGGRLTSWGAPSPAFRPWRSYAALAHLHLGRRQEALDLALEELDLARKWTAASAIGRALLTVGVVTGGAAAIPWLTEAVTVLRRSPARLLLACVLVELGGARWNNGQREAARGDLTEGKRLAEECGSLPLLGELAKLPTDAVSRSEAMPQPTLPNAIPLTPHEYRVAGLVVAGNSNDEIARKLCVSRRAIEFHLTNVYRKLGVRRRTQLPTALAAFSTD
ncbi:helix-turn-helix transcriptional regulator [Lentzea sp. E54]|uniref:helix-turn-helix transcriptional regulator n=1 Tax=Lentzea xerophila TaxID=3435883 RepID=UPI003DA4D3F8